MQKVEGSNPFSRFREGLHLRVFSRVGRDAGWSVDPVGALETAVGVIEQAVCRRGIAGAEVPQG
jgi:hypothetical protein